MPLPGLLTIDIDYLDFCLPLGRLPTLVLRRHVVSGDDVGVLLPGCKQHLADHLRYTSDLAPSTAGALSGQPRAVNARTG